MSLKILLPGVAVAVGLGLMFGTHMRPTLATRSEQPAIASVEDASGAAVDLTPAYVSPASLHSLNAVETPARFEPDRVEVQVRRDLAQANAELRASEAALEQYHRAAVLVTGVVDAGYGLAAALSPGFDATPSRASTPPEETAGSAAAAADRDERASRD